MITEEEQAFLNKRPMKRLTFCGFDDLYCHPWFGAYTIKQCIELEQIEAKNNKLPKKKLDVIVPCSNELMARHNRCVDMYGVGLF